MLQNVFSTGNHSLWGGKGERTRMADKRGRWLEGGDRCSELDVVGQGVHYLSPWHPGQSGNRQGNIFSPSLSFTETTRIQSRAFHTCCVIKSTRPRWQGLKVRANNTPSLLWAVSSAEILPVREVSVFPPMFLIHNRFTSPDQLFGCQKMTRQRT